MGELHTLALRVAKKAHMGQVDKGGSDYIDHLIYVANQVASEEQKAVALLQHVVEESHCTLDSLRKSGFPERVIEAVAVLMKQPELTDDQYWAQVKQNDLARGVKLVALRHDSDLSRIPELDLADFERVENYAKVIKFLENT